MTEMTPPSAAAPAGKPKRRIRRALKIVAIAVAMLAVSYGGLCWWYYSQAPRLSRNYAADLNAPILKIPPERRAWTHYRRALEVLEPRQENEFAEKPTDKDWPATAAFVRRNAAAIEMIRQASRIRPMGVLLQDGVVPEDFAWRLRHDSSFTEEDAKNLPAPSENPSLAAIFFQNLSAYMDLTRALRDDAFLAAADRDGRRMTANLIAMFDLAEQVHEAPMIVDQSVATTIAGMAVSAVGKNLAESAEAFREEDLTALTARLQRILDEQAFRIHTDGDETFYADSIQRYFTDDGSGDGVFTIDGDWSDENEQAGDEDDDWLGDCWDRFRVPIWAALVMPRRSELAATNEQYHRELDRVFRLPPWERNAALADFVDEVPLWAALHKWDSKMVQPHGHVYIMKQVDAELYQYIGGVLIAMAAVRDLRIDQQWPTSLADVVPDFLREIPLDQFTGRPLLYMLIDGKPVVYSVGADLDDDGGQPPAIGDTGSVRAYDEETADGDWILWPPSTEADDTGDDDMDDVDAAND